MPDRTFCACGRSARHGGRPSRGRAAGLSWLQPRRPLRRPAATGRLCVQRGLFTVATFVYGLFGRRTAVMRAGSGPGGEGASPLFHAQAMPASRRRHYHRPGASSPLATDTCAATGEDGRGGVPCLQPVPLLPTAAQVSPAFSCRKRSPASPARKRPAALTGGGPLCWASGPDPATEVRASAYVEPTTSWSARGCAAHTGGPTVTVNTTGSLVYGLMCVGFCVVDGLL